MVLMPELTSGGTAVPLLSLYIRQLRPCPVKNALIPPGRLLPAQELLPTQELRARPRPPEQLRAIRGSHRQVASFNAVTG